jgi:hypothetical protein
MPREKLEEKLYSPTVKALKSMFDSHYCDKSRLYGKPLLGTDYRPQTGLSEAEIDNPHLEITAQGQFSEPLKFKQSDPYLFEQLFAEELRPDILGYVIKSKGKKPSPPETIDVEIKAHELTLRDLMQAKLYETIFGPKHTFLLSPQGMTGEKMAVVMKHGELLRGKVIIGKCHENGVVLFDPRLVDSMPSEGFKQFCIESRYYSNAWFALTLEEAMNPKLKK